MWVLSQNTPSAASTTFSKDTSRPWAGVRISWSSVVSVTYGTATATNAASSHTTSAITPPANTDTKIAAIAAIDIGPDNTSTTIAPPSSPWSTLVNYKTASATQGQLIAVSERSVAGSASPAAVTATFGTVSGVEEVFLFPIALVGTTSALAPTVDAGADVASHPVNTQFTRTATENANNSAITSRAWTIVSGPTGVGSTIGTTATLNWTPTAPTGIGTYLLRYSATNAIGSGVDDIQITVTGVPVGASAPAGILLVEGAAVAVTVIPAVRASLQAGEIEIAGAPVSLVKYGALGAPVEITVEGTAPRLARHVQAEAFATVLVEGLAISVSRRLRAAEIEVFGPGVQVSYGSDGAGGQSGFVGIPRSSTTRFIAQSVRTGEFISLDLPLVNPSISLVLSGPTTITGTLSPEDPEIRDLVESRRLDAYATWIHMEVEGIVRASGILQPIQMDGETYSVEATGPSGYLRGMPFLGELSAIAIDPADVVRAIWAHVQGYPDANLGVTVIGSTPVRIGEEEPQEGVEYPDGERPNGPYKLSWWEGPDCGREVDQLASQTPFDYVERCAWNASKTKVDHWIDLAYSRIGGRRDDLRFADGENVIGAIPAEETEDLFASQVIVYGSGEGRDTIRGYAGRALGSRLRRVVILQDATIDTTARANSLAAVELERRQGLIDVTDLEVEARHPNAEFGTYAVGDDIFIDVEVAWLGRLRQFERIISITYAPDAETVRLQLRRADAFRYGG